MMLFIGLSALFLTGCIRISTDRYEAEWEGDQWQENKIMVRRDQDGVIPASVQKVYVENRGGMVKVTGVPENFGWRNELKCFARDEATAHEFADRCQLEAVDNNGTYRLVLTIPKGRRTPRIESNMELRVPQSVAVEVKNHFGGTEVVQVNGLVRAQNHSGRLFLKSLPGEVEASTSFSDLVAEDIGPANLRNQSGALEIKNVGGDLKAETSFGRMRVRGVKGTVELRNQSGEITAEEIAGELKARTSFATMRVQNTGPAQLSNQSGEIDALRVGGDLMAKTSFSRLTARDIQGQAELSNQSGEINASEVTGPLKARTSFSGLHLSGPCPAVSAHNQSGPIEITAPQATQIEAETSFSSIQVKLPAEAKPLIMAATRFGNIKSDFPVLVKETMPEEQFRNDPALPKVTLKTHNGDIRIQKINARL